MASVQSYAKKPVVVVGDGWSALATVSHLLVGKPVSDQQIVWVAGSASRVLSPLPGFETAFGTEGLEMWAALATRLDVDLGQIHSGTFTREFKNKSFRTTTWSGKQELDAQKNEREETLWGPEKNVAQLAETRFDLSAAQIEFAVREKLSPADTLFPSLRRIEGNALSAVKLDDGKVRSVTLASGEEIECETLIYADRWNLLAKVQGLPKALPFTRAREAHGVLQATFSHETPVGVGVLEGFFGTMNREAGEEFDRHCWGYFSSDGLKSFWMICLAADEVEDNHEIAKKLRRMKSTLDKMFTGASWIPHPEKGFMANVSHEQVRFEESLIFSDSKVPLEVITLPDGIEGVSFLTDGYGPARAFEQVNRLLGPVQGGAGLYSESPSTEHELHESPEV